MKGKLIAGYLLIALVFGTGGWLFGDYRYMSFSYNLGRGAVWPVSMLPMSTDIDGSSPELFARTIMQMQAEHRQAEGVHRFNEGLGAIAYYHYAKQTPVVDLAMYKKAMASGRLPADFIKQLLTNHAILNDVRMYMDGMSFGAVIDERADMQEEIEKLLAGRPAAAPAPTPVAMAVAAPAAAPALDQE